MSDSSSETTSVADNKPLWAFVDGTEGDVFDTKLHQPCVFLTRATAITFPVSDDSAGTDAWADDVLDAICDAADGKGLAAGGCA